MRTSPRLALALVVSLLSGLLLFTATSSSAERLGPGRSTQPGFSGYTTRSGHELGVARLPGGVTGICLDTGTRSWPRQTGHAREVVDPVVGYLLSVHLERARHDGVLAVALWWAVGKVRGLNSQPQQMRARLAEMGQESPQVHREVLRRARALVAEARRNAAPRRGYAAPRPTLISDGPTGSVAGLGLRSATGHWVPGITVTVTLRGARFNDGRTSLTFRSVTTQRVLPWQRVAGKAVAVRVRYSRVPQHHYRLYRAGARVQRVAASAGVRTLSTGARTTALATPSVTTRVSLQRATTGDVLVDAVTVSGTRGASVTGEWQLLGPVAPDVTGCRERRWIGAPVAGQGRFRADGDSTLQIGATRVTTTGCYTYRERLDGSRTTTAAPWTPAGLVEETSHVTSRPAFRTRVNRQRAVAGATLVDRVVLTGVPQGPGATALTGQWQLLGPVSPDSRQRCTGARWSGAPLAATGTFSITRNGTLHVGRTQIDRGGCYTYRERIEPTLHSAEAPWSRAGLAEETSLISPVQPRVPQHPQVDTGGSRGTPPMGRASSTSPQVKVAGIRLSAALREVDFRGSTLPAPEGHQAGLWADGAELSSVVGTTVITGHVSDDSDRPGVFHNLRRVRVGQQVQTIDSAGVIRHWRVVRIRSFDRRRLPRGLFAQHITRRLTLITCTGKVSYPGGFHYRKNLVVEAEPW